MLVFILNLHVDIYHNAIEDWNRACLSSLIIYRNFCKTNVEQMR